MTHLSIVGSHSISGVSELQRPGQDIARPTSPHSVEKFNNKTNGVTARRWLLQANPLLARLITNAIGNRKVTDLERLRALESLADYVPFHQEFAAIKQRNKERLTRLISETTSIVVDPYSLFDVHIKRIHEYKRQLLNVMRIVHDYLRLIEDNHEPACQDLHLLGRHSRLLGSKQIIKRSAASPACQSRSARGR